MTGIVIVLLVVIAAMFGFLLWQNRIVESLLRNRDIDHAKCMSHIAHYTGNQFAAMVLTSAADDYASAQGQYEVDVIIQSGAFSDNEPIPAVWMRGRASDLLNEIRT
jgi:hypothetical protein